MAMPQMIILAIACAVAPEPVTASDTSDAALMREIEVYLDRLVDARTARPTLDEPRFLPIELRFGTKRSWAELTRQVSLRDSDLLYARFFGLDRSKMDMRAIAVRGLNSDDEHYRDRALSWCARHAEMLDADQQKRAKDLLAAAVKAGNGRNLEDLKRLATFGTKQDVPWLRRIYQDHFFEREPTYGVAWPIFRTVTRSQFLLILAQIGDPDARKEIAVAIGQDKNAAQRAWGIFMAANLGDKSLVPLIGKALDDKRQVPDPIEEWRDPNAKGPYLLRVSYHRVCDVALRAIWTLDDPKDKWPFKMNIMSGLNGGWTFLHGMSNSIFPYVEPLEKKANQQRGVFHNHTILGYTDEQLEQVREYMRKRPALPDKGK